MVKSVAWQEAHLLFQLSFHTCTLKVFAEVKVGVVYLVNRFHLPDQNCNHLLCIFYHINRSYWVVRLHQPFLLFRLLN